MSRGTAALLVCAVAASLYALDLSFAEEKRQRELPKTGTLADSLVSGYDSKTVDMPWGEEVGDREAPPISGSVARVSPTEWMARIFNNTTDTYSVDLEVLQVGERGSRIKSDFFSYVLKPGESQSRSIQTTPNVAQCSLNLRGWKNLSEKSRERETAAEK